MDISEVTHGAKLVIGATVAFLIVSIFNWQEVDVGFASAGASMWHGWGVLAGLIAIAILVWEGLRLANLKVEIGLTPAMVHWWFRHIGDPIAYAGRSMSGYLAWHPLDHIRWELSRPAPGGDLHHGRVRRDPGPPGGRRAPRPERPVGGERDPGPQRAPRRAAGDGRGRQPRGHRAGA